jgi:thioredoxin 1
MTVLYFSAAWCGPCKVFKPILQQTSAELGISVNYVDVDSNGAMAQQYGINSVPTLMIVNPNTNQVVKRQSGAMSKSALTQFLSSAR